MKMSLVVDGLRSDVVLHMEQRSGWPIYTLTSKASHTPRRTVVYLHGGAWVNEITSQHWQLAAQIVADARVQVVVPIYPLVPFTTAAEVVPTIAQLAAEKVAPDHSVCLAGDSAGGQMALSAALMLRDEHRLVLPQTLLISPVLDVSLSNPSIGATSPSILNKLSVTITFAPTWPACARRDCSRYSRSQWG